VTRVVEPNEFAVTLGEFLRALHVDAPRDGPRHAFHRGVSLAVRDEGTRDPSNRSIDQLDGSFDPSALVAAWEQALSVRPWARNDAWLHGDLHPANLLVVQGRLSGVLDFGDLCVGDPRSA